MAQRILTHDGDLIEGIVVERPNRFVLEVEFGEGPERVFLGDPGALEVLKQGKRVLCEPVHDPERKTGYDAVAVEAGDIWVSLKAALANDLFAVIIEDGVLDRFHDYSIAQREPELPGHGRADFLLETPDGETVYTEVKSCTHVDDGVAKFPDRPTKRGRRHVRALTEICDSGAECHLVFVVQRPDAERFGPYKDVDPEFASVLRTARETGVEVTVLSIEFDPPTYYLAAKRLPVTNC